MNRLFALCGLLILAGAIFLRLPHLERRPMHNDEGINALKIQGLWEKGAYRYDPQEYHGPSLYYATLPFLRLSSTPNFDQVSEGTLRLVSVFFGTALILLLWLIADGLGASATLCAGLLMAISPAMVFYSRYFIHEMPLVCFTMMVLAGGWRYARTRSIGWAIFCGLGLGLMYATKETFVISLAAMAAAGVMTGLLGTDSSRKQHKGFLSRFWPSDVPKGHVVIALVTAAAVSLPLFTSLFTNASGPLDSIRTYLPWLHRAGGESPHIHPWNFYFERLAFFHPARSPVWSEGLILVLAAIGAVAGFTRTGLVGANATLVRFIAFYTVILTAAYSAISYKTPWCLLNFLLGMILLAGVGAVALISWARFRALQAIAVLLMIAASGHLGWQAWRATHTFESDRRNPYVYAHTAANILELVQKVKAIAAVHPDKNQVLIKVIGKESYWPLPWYLRQFNHVGWWDRAPANPYAPIVIAGSSLGLALDDKSNKAWLMPGMFELRPGVFFELYVEFGLWKKYVESLPPARD